MEEYLSNESGESLLLDKDEARKWAITISPPPNTEGDPLKIQYIQWIVKLQSIKSKLFLIPEMALNEKDYSYRLHFHGLIEEGDPLEFQEDLGKLRKMCFICIKKVKYLGGWLKYCYKEINKTKDLLLSKNSSPKRVILTNKTIQSHPSTNIRQGVEYIVQLRDKKKTVLEYLENQ